MAAAANAAPATGESKSALKKKSKAKTAAGIEPAAQTTPAVPEANTASSQTADDEKSEHPYLRELAKQIRSINKKLSGSQKTDATLAENPGVSLDDLVAQRKINADQKASALKKPGLQAQLAQLEEQSVQYRKFDADSQTKLSQLKEELTAGHQKELDKLRQEVRTESTTSGASELRSKLLTFSQFLRAAAHKRTIEEEADTDEGKAFEGALLLVYGGDQKAVDTAINLIDGSDEQVPSIEGVSLPVTYAQVKQAAVEHAPFQSEEAWVDQVAEATGGEDHAASGSDPTLTHAGLTELEAPATNGDHNPDTTSAAPATTGETSGNVAGERWNTEAGVENGLDESYEVIPRPNDEVDIPAEAAPSSSQPQQGASWADETQADQSATTGNQAGEGWDTKAAGDGADDGWGSAPTQTVAATGDASAIATPADDGFHEVAGRHRGRGGRGRGEGGDRGRGGGRRGNFRGRGPRGRSGDGESRGEFRGGRGGGRGGPRGGAGAGNASQS